MKPGNPLDDLALGDEFATKSGTHYRVTGFLISENKVGKRSRCVRVDVWRKGGAVMVEYLKVEVFRSRLALSSVVNLSPELPVDWSRVPLVLHSEIGKSDHPVLF